jgi:hypothetical protein
MERRTTLVIAREDLNVDFRFLSLLSDGADLLIPPSFPFASSPSSVHSFSEKPPSRLRRSPGLEPPQVRPRLPLLSLNRLLSTRIFRSCKSIHSFITSILSPSPVTPSPPLFSLSPILTFLSTIVSARAGRRTTQSGRPPRRPQLWRRYSLPRGNRGWTDDPDLAPSRRGDRQDGEGDVRCGQGRGLSGRLSSGADQPGESNREQLPGRLVS